MRKRTLESLGGLVRDKRGQQKLRETALQVGIGPATLMRSRMVAHRMLRHLGKSVGGLRLILDLSWDLSRKRTVQPR